MLIGLLWPVDEWCCLGQGALRVDIVREAEEWLIRRGVLHRHYSRGEGASSAGAWSDFDGDDAVSIGCSIALDRIYLPEDDKIGIGSAIRLTGTSAASTLAELSGGQRHLAGDHGDREVSDGGYLCCQFYGGGLSDGEGLGIDRVEGDGLVVVEQGGNLIATVAVEVANDDAARYRR